MELEHNSSNCTPVHFFIDLNFHSHWVFIFCFLSAVIWVKDMLYYLLNYSIPKFIFHFQYSANNLDSWNKHGGVACMPVKEVCLLKEIWLCPSIPVKEMWPLYMSVPVKDTWPFFFSLWLQSQWRPCLCACKSQWRRCGLCVSYARDTHFFFLS